MSDTQIFIAGMVTGAALIILLIAALDAWTGDQPESPATKVRQS